MLVPIVLALLGVEALQEEPASPLEACCFPLSIASWLNLFAGWLDIFPALVTIGMGVLGLILVKRYQGRVSYRAVAGIVLGVGILSWVVYWLVAIAPALATR